MATAFDELAQKIPPGDLGGKDPQMVRDYLGRSSPAILSGQPSLPTSAAPTPSTGPSGPSGKGVAGDKPPTGLLAAPGGALGDISGTPATTGGDTSSEGAPSDSVGGQGGFPSFSTQSGMFGLSGSPLGVTGTLGAPGGPQFGLTVGPGTISPSFSAGHVTGNPEVDAALSAALGAGGKQGLGALGLPSSVSASFLSALTHAPALVGLVGGLISAMGQPMSLVSLAHAIASMSPTSVASLQATLADPNPESQISLEQALAIMSGAQMGPTYGGPQAPSSTRGYGGGAPSLGPSGLGFGLDFSNPSVRSGFESQSGPKANAFEDTGPPSAPPAAPAVGPEEGAPTDPDSTGGPGAPGPGGAPAGDTGGSSDAE